MKKLALLIGAIILIILGLIFYINYSDSSYLYNIKKRIINNTNIEKIEYISVYDNYYIVLDDKYLYLIDNKYNTISEVEKNKVHDNSNNYGIIYSSNCFMYFNDIYKDNEVIYEYYDIYSYELINKVIVGGKNGSGN